MKIRTLLLIFASLFISGALIAQEDVMVLEGGLENGGVIENTINDDVTDGVRNNPDRIYELKRGQFYMMHAPLNVDNPGGTLTIRAEEGDGPKPVIVRVPVNEVDLDRNVIKGSLTLQGIQYHFNQTNGGQPGGWGNWQLSVDDSKLMVEDCLFEFCSGSIFNTDGIESGQVMVFRNNYFRDFHNGNEWWAARVVNCKVPVDTLIYENNSHTGSGLTVLGQECMFDYAVINHNTFINNSKYPFLNQYWKTLYMTNNLFVNANWVGEDRENVATGGQDPDGRAGAHMLHGLVGVDTITTNIWVDDAFLIDTLTLTEDVDEISDYIWYAADNVCVASTTLQNYYDGGLNDVYDTPLSYLTWGGLGEGPWEVWNVPGIFMNSRTEALIADWDNIIAENNSVYEHTAEDLGFGTDPLPQAAADVYIQWNRAKWGVPDVEAPALTETYFGDYDANTVPGVETEDSKVGGITKISDMIEDFSYTMDLTSKSDGLPIGALHWIDMEFDNEASLAAVMNAYLGIGIGVQEAIAESEVGLVNYPNPFDSHTTIRFNLKEDSHVNLSVYDISGRLIVNLLNESRSVGTHTVEFTPDFASSSTYFYKLTTDFGTETRKMMLLK